MKHYIKPTALAVLLMMAACTTDELGGEDQTGTHDPDAPIEFPVTRTTDGGEEEEATVFVEGTEIGVFVEGYPSDRQNLRYLYDESGKFVAATPDDRIFRGELTIPDCTYTAYYPYNSAGDYDTPAIRADQTTEEAYYASDALISTGKLDDYMTFSHRMAKVIVTTPDPVTAVSITGQPLYEGGTADQTIQLLKADADGQTWRGILVPGTGDINLQITMDGETYKASFSNKTLEAGGQHTFKVNNWKDGSGYTIIDLSKRSAEITSGGNYRIIQSKGGTTSNYIRMDSRGGRAYLYLEGVNIRAPVAVEVVHGTLTLYLQDNQTRLVSTGDGQPGISLVNSDANINLHKSPYLKESFNVYAEGGPVNTFIPGGPAIGVYCDKTGGNIDIRDCKLTGVAGGRYSAVIGTSGDTSWDYSRTSACGNITIVNVELNLTNSPGDAGDHIGNGRSANFNAQKLKCGNIELYDCTLNPPDMLIGKMTGDAYTYGRIKVNE